MEDCQNFVPKMAQTIQSAQDIFRETPNLDYEYV